MKVSSNKMNLLLARKGWTVTQLGKACGVSRQTLSMILSGKTCRPNTAGKIAISLKVDVEDILETDTKKEQTQ